MKRKLIISEGELIQYIKIVTEQVNFDDYEEEDYFDAFFIIFKNWLKNNLDDDYTKYPIKYLINKYGYKFMTDNFGTDFKNSNREDDFQISRYEIPRIVRKFVEKGLHKLPGLYKEQKFTEKFKRHLETFMEDLDYPDYMTFEFSEEIPYKVDLTVNVDFARWMKADKEQNINSYGIEKKFKKFLGDYLGVDFGKSSHGQLDFDVKQINNNGEELWVENELNKIIKKKFKESPESKKVKSLSFKVGSHGGTLEIRFTSNSSWSNRRPTKEKYQEILTSLGYGPNLKLEI